MTDDKNTSTRSKSTGHKSTGLGRFEDLEVFKRSYKIALRVHEVSLTFPAIDQRALGDQVRRASKSICANIAEGYGSQTFSKAEFKRFLMMAIRSADEMRVWARFAFDLHYIDEAIWRTWRDEYQALARMLTSLHAKA